MPTYRFTITGIRHHDFRGRLDELYEPALGKRMSISVEHDNPQEPDAVIVYWGKKWVGYVRSGKDREQAYSLIKASGRGSLLGKIVGYDRENRWLWLEVSTDCDVAPTCEDKTNVLTNWSFDGEILPTDEEEVRLHAMLCNLEMTIENREPWDDDMEEWLEYVGQNLWRDISCETSGQVRYILELLTAGSTEHKEYAHAADRLQYANGRYLYTNLEELDLLKQLQTNGTKDVGKIICLCFDNGKYGQERVGTQSVTARVDIR